MLLLVRVYNANKTSNQENNILLHTTAVLSVQAAHLLAWTCGTLKTCGDLVRLPLAQLLESTKPGKQTTQREGVGVVKNNYCNSHPELINSRHEINFHVQGRRCKRYCCIRRVST